MSAEFSVGETAIVNGRTVTVRLGPCRWGMFDVGYVVEDSEGVHYLVREGRITRPAPEFALGDVVRRQGSRATDEFTLEVGPFDAFSLRWWGARRASSSEVFPLFEADIERIRRPGPPAVGDTVRITAVKYDGSEGDVGQTGVITRIDDDDEPFLVELPDGDYTWATKVEVIRGSR